MKRRIFMTSMSSRNWPRVCNQAFKNTSLLIAECRQVETGTTVRITTDLRKRGAARGGVWQKGSFVRRKGWQRVTIVLYGMMSMSMK
jgi:hypothetical protein